MLRIFEKNCIALHDIYFVFPSVRPGTSVSTVTEVNLRCVERGGRGEPEAVSACPARPARLPGGPGNTCGPGKRLK